MDLIVCPIEYRADDSRLSPGRIVGTLLTYETRAKDRPEVFGAGALEWPTSGVILNIAHNAQVPITRFVPEVRGDRVLIDAALPDTSTGRDAAVMVRDGTLRGLSIEFRPTSEDRAGGVRRITRASLLGAGLVGDGAYQTELELRRRTSRGVPWWL